MEPFKIEVDRVNVTTNYNDRFVAIVYDREGRCYTHHDASFADYAIAKEFCDKIADRGYLNGDLWDCSIPYGSLAWIQDGMEERIIQDEKDGLL